MTVSHRQGVESCDVSPSLDTCYRKGLPSLGQPRAGVFENKVKGDAVRVASRFGNKQSGGIYDKRGLCPTVHYGKRGPFPHHIFENPSGTKTLHKNVSEIGEAKKLYSPEGKSTPVKNHDIKILQKSPDWRGKGMLREFDEESPTIRRDMGDNLPMALEHRGRTNKTPQVYDLIPSLRSESHGHQPKILHTSFPDGLREYEDESPAVQTPAGGGHLPRVLMPKATSKLPFMGSAPKPKNIEEESSFPLQTDAGYSLAVQTGKSTKEAEDDEDEDIYSGYTEVRKLTPAECERLQGFPDGWTEKGINENGDEVEISDTQRYKMMGNAVTVNVVEFIAERFNRAIEEGRL